jgi:hypothetical protein
MSFASSICTRCGRSYLFMSTMTSRCTWCSNTGVRLEAHKAREARSSAWRAGEHEPIAPDMPELPKPPLVPQLSLGDVLAGRRAERRPVAIPHRRRSRWQEW